MLALMLTGVEFADNRCLHPVMPAHDRLGNDIRVAKIVATKEPGVFQQQTRGELENPRTGKEV